MRRAGCRRGAKAVISSLHQLTRQRFDSLTEAPITRHVEQFVDDRLERCRIDMAPKGLSDLADRVVRCVHFGFGAPGYRHRRRVG